MTDIIPVTQGVIEPERISPEGLEVANKYLVLLDINLVAQELHLTPDLVVDQLNDTLVKRYLDSRFMDSGYRNRERLASVMDDVINKKLEEMDEAEISSTKDIADLLMMQHKMNMDTLDKQIKLAEIEAKKKTAASITENTVNIQDNSGMGGNYGSLLQKLLGTDHAQKGSSD